MLRGASTAALLAIWLAPATARAGGPICDRVTADAIEIDGMLDDWQGTRKQRAGGDEPGFDLRCAYDEQHLYLAAKITDYRIIRTGKSDPRQDALTVELAAAAGASAVSLTALPGAGKQAPRRTWGGKAVPAWVKVEDTLQQDGWSLELAVPLQRIPGLGAAPPSAWARVVYRDVDASGKPAPVELKGELGLAGGVDLLRSFLRATKLDKKQVKVDVKADLGGSPGVERVVAGGAVVGVIASSFGYMTLPVASPADVRKVEVRDLAGDGRSVILTEYRQKGTDGGTRTVVAVWRWMGEARFDRVLAFEIGKELGGRRLTNRWLLAPRGGKGKRGADIRVEAAEAVGWDEDSWAEAPATDVNPILLPWEPKTRAVYRYDGERAREVASRAGR